MDKKKRLALVTGGSRGIGKAIALEFAENGIDVVVTGRNERRLIETSRELRDCSVRAYHVGADIGNPEGVKRISEFLTHSELTVSILINNAAIIHPRIPLVDFDMKDWEEIINVNLIGAVRITKMLLPGMITQGYGKIINISSIGGRKGAYGRSAYRATKAALISFTESLAAEVKPSGIDVNCICPGGVVTEGYIEAFGEKSIQEGNMMDPGEIAALSLFLISSKASAVTGAIIDAYGSSNPLFNT